MKISLLEPIGIDAELMDKLSAPLKEMGHEFVYYDNKTTDRDELLKRACDSEIVMIANNPLPDSVIEKCDKLSENDKYTYVYIFYNLVLENEQEYPCVGTYMVEKQGKKYYVMSPSEITDELRNQAATDYAEFMTTDAYKSYTKEYNVFMKKNPGYEEKIANKLNAE